MPKQVQLPDGTVGQFPDSMSDDDIKGALRKKFPPPETPPGPLEPHSGPLSVGDIFRGAGSGLASLVDPATYKGMAKNIRDILPSYRMVSGVPVPVPNEAGMQNLVKQGQDLATQAKEHPGYTAAQFIAPIAAGEGVKRIVPPALRGGPATVSSKYAPHPVEIAGEKIPVLVGEAEPDSPAGRLQERLKRSGTAQPKFQAVEREQQEAVKNVIRKTAQETSGLVGPISEEPGAAMKDATTATFNKGRQMYEALDGQLQGYSAPLNAASKIVQNAVSKARNLGIDVDPAADSVLFDGKRIDPKSNPELWQKLRDQGIVDEAGQGTPLAAYKSVYSQLLKMQRSASDEAVRYRIGQEIKNMDENMQTALRGTPIYDNWKAADSVWAKAYALRDVADAITDSTKGTPAGQQSPGLARVPTKLQGASLVDKLNTLADNGILRKAFSPDEARNLRQSADILDRIQRTPVGRGAGESMSRSRGLAHAISGSRGPIIGAALGGAAGFISGNPIIGAEAGAGMGFLVQAIGERALVRVMTKTDGVQAIRSLSEAKTPAQTQSALRAITVLAGVSRLRHPVFSGNSPVQ